MKFRETSSHRSYEEGRHGHEGVKNGGEIYGSGQYRTDMRSEADRFNQLIAELPDFNLEIVKNEVYDRVESCIELCSINMKMVFECSECGILDLETANQYISAYNECKQRMTELYNTMKLSYEKERLSKSSNLSDRVKANTIQSVDFDYETYEQLNEEYTKIEERLKNQHRSFIKKLSKINLTNEKQGMAI